jgi:hypothetical protein
MSSNYVIYQIVLLLIGTSKYTHGESSSNIDAFDFQTNLESDPEISKYRMNYVTVAANNTQSPTKEITVCLRIKPSTTIAHCIFHENGLALTFNTEKYGFLMINTIWILFQFKEAIVPLKWYHVCISYNEAYIIMIMGGDVLVDRKFHSFSKLGKTTIHFTDRFTFGMALINTNRPLISITRSLVTDFHIWSKAIPSIDMDKFTTNCFYKIADKTLYLIVQWAELDVVGRGEMAKKASVSLREVCGEKEYQKISIILPSTQPYKICKKNCEKLGGRLPLFRSEDELNINITISSKNRMDEQGKDRVKSECGYYVWMPIIQGEKIQPNEEYEWLEDALNDTPATSFLPWEISQPNGQDLQQCVLFSFETNHYTDIECDRNYCCVCEFSGEVNFHLRGMPETYDADIHYIFDPEVQRSDELAFTGYKRNRIIWKSKEQKWVLFDRDPSHGEIGNHKIFEDEVLVGLYDWNLNPVEMSRTQEERHIPLKFSDVSQKCF